MTEQLVLDRTGASLNRGSSRQDYETPWEFIHAVERRFGKIAVDLAAHRSTAKAERYIDEATDSFAVDWHKLTTSLRPLWLNPTFRNMHEWAEKCHHESRLGARIIMLSPASVSTNWFADHVHGVAHCIGIRPRITFVGETQGYPKDLMLTLWGPHIGAGFSCWRWK